jgi:hypothetical protein
LLRENGIFDKTLRDMLKSSKIKKKDKIKVKEIKKEVLPPIMINDRFK